MATKFTMLRLDRMTKARLDDLAGRWGLPTADVARTLSYADERTFLAAMRCRGAVEGASVEQAAEAGAA